MDIRTHRVFNKQFKKLSQQHQTMVDKAIVIFRKNPFDPRLANHGLKGRMHGKRSIAATDDLRIIFQEFDGYTVVIMLTVGNHGKVYK